MCVRGDIVRIIILLESNNSNDNKPDETGDRSAGRDKAPRAADAARGGVQGGGIDCGYKFISYSDCPGLWAPQFSRDFLYY